MNLKVMMFIIMCKCKEYVKYAIKVGTKHLHLHDDLTFNIAVHFDVLHFHEKRWEELQYDITAFEIFQWT